MAPQWLWRCHWNTIFLCFLTGCMWDSKKPCSVYWFRMTGSSGDLTLMPEGKGKHLAFRWFYPSEKSVYSSSSNSYLLSCWDILLNTVWGMGVKDTRGHRNNWLPSVTEGFKTVIRKCYQCREDRLGSPALWKNEKMGLSKNEPNSQKQKVFSLESHQMALFKEVQWSMAMPS